MSKLDRFVIYRFWWFTVNSWKYLQGMRWKSVGGFWAAWRKFNASYLHDTKCEGCCSDDHE